MKESLFTILITVISFLALLPLTSALEFTMDAPESVTENMPFEVTINFESSDTYDVKIFVHLEDKNNYISQVNDGGTWRSPRTYMKETFPSQQTYEVKILDFMGEAELCARLRKTGASSFSEVCQPINVGELVSKDISEEEIESEEVNKEPSVKEESNTYADPLRMRIVYAFMVFCAAVVCLVWFRKL